MTGCTNIGLTQEEPKPPKAFIEITNETSETVLGTYCWSYNGMSECADAPGPIELLEGRDPIEVNPGEKITFVMEYEPKPNKIHLLQISNNEESEVKLSNNHFLAPSQKGVYYYSYGAWWMDEKEENVSNGDAHYAFAIEVK
ncbi:hypothetical protein WQ57_09845 [Mesobacillus campisalis]|uniref:Uncharacterized protein n=2 Tax=Mesobacillus campisalis TaxID=1408103 RepID=A0A0M2SVP5_9BACI|nr:hypothetical protein WQ57_09845 [Mesobacillus campisalis]